MNPIQLKNISKFMSLVLRHEPQKIGIELDENGWVGVLTLTSKLARKFPGPRPCGVSGLPALNRAVNTSRRSF
jgi:RNA:NAD 2'-phosphotransferase (TPT1/KptA family)